MMVSRKASADRRQNPAYSVTVQLLPAGPRPRKNAPIRLTQRDPAQPMPIRQTDILKDISPKINPDINPYVAKMTAAMMSGSLPVLQGSALQGRCGNWRKTMDQLHATRAREPGATETRKLIVEIGCHLGLTLNQMASNHLESDFLGLDITFKRVVTAAERSIKNGLTNIATILGNARGLDAIFADGEVDGFIIFFPDPWLKRSQTKHRLVDSQFTDLLLKKLAPGGFVWMKTDQQLYSKAACEAFAGSGFLRVESIEFFNNETYESTFERKFRLQGLPAWECRWLKAENGPKASPGKKPGHRSRNRNAGL